MAKRNFDRVKRLTRTVPGGEAALEVLSSKKARKLLVQAAEQGVPPISGVSKLLLETLGSKSLEQTSLRQFCGIVTRTILDDEGFELQRGGVRLRGDPVFAVGATYIKRRENKPRSSSLLNRIFENFSLPELEEARAIIDVMIEKKR